MTITVAILAGGRSRRMGQDKAQIQWHGASLLERMAREARKTSLPVLVVGRARPDDWPVPDATFVPDDWPGRGPLGGLLTALGHIQGSVLLVACDMPLLTAEALRWLAAQQPKTSEMDGLAVVNAGQIEPLFSIYGLSCRALAERNMAEGRLSLHGIINQGQFERIDAPGWVSAQLVNINTPEQWEQFEGKVK